jgi:site-specific recombinase XerD
MGRCAAGSTPPAGQQDRATRRAFGCAGSFLKAYRKSLPRLAKAANAPVFSLPGQSYNAIRSVWHRVRKAANLPDTLRIHDLRHSFASHAIMAGETLFSTSRLLGHSKIQTTARYAHLADTALLDCAERWADSSLRRRARPRATFLFLPCKKRLKALEAAAGS